MNVKIYFQNAFFRCLMLDLGNSYRIFEVIPKFPDEKTDSDVSFYFSNLVLARKFTDRFSSFHSAQFWRLLYSKNHEYSFDFVYKFLSKYSDEERLLYINGVRV